MDAERQDFGGDRKLAAGFLALFLGKGQRES
jgi:hypothetical protein